jgi:hypothetical protein
MSETALIDRYCEVWSEPDEARRAELLEAVWASGGTYLDPAVHAVGSVELLFYISEVLKRRPGSKVVRTSQVDLHHNVARFTWRAVEANGNALPEGIDFALLTSDGSKIERIIGFFGPLKPRSD